ncbi:glycosyltransferase group 1 family protein [Bacteroides clarus CAG:160]|jgi:glycosyltransferase involved in cell wall biosynthesis|nr:glycosyltransferase group 1 family protein [Bacteroides clarus CAG:160]
MSKLTKRIMNILFINDNNISPQCGGIERITDVLAQYLEGGYDDKCFLAYYKDLPFKSVSNSFCLYEKLIHGSEYKQLVDIIKRYNINNVIVQQLPELMISLKSINKELGGKFQLIYVQHDYLSSNLTESIYNYICFLWKYGKFSERIKSFIKMIIFPFYKIYSKILLYNKFYPAFCAADRIVLLSDKFIPYGKRLIGDYNLHKISVIGNCLTLDTTIDIHELPNKRKEVLIVSRLNEDRKRISLALRIWKLVKENTIADDWKLIIVGQGKHLNIYKKMVQDWNLMDISFVGTQESVISYYKSASIFMMTSDVEGWGLTLTESLQMGVIPLAFDTFESLTDIIQNGYNGYLIPKYDIQSYSQKIWELMSDAVRRGDMAKQCLESSQKHSPELVVKKWHNIML